MKLWKPSKEENDALATAIESARQVQTFLWEEANGNWGLEEWLRMFRKRVAKLEEIKRDNPHANVELKKRLLQTAALSIALIGIIDQNGIPWNPTPNAPPSNLPKFKTSRINNLIKIYHSWKTFDKIIFCITWITAITTWISLILYIIKKIILK